MPSWDSVLNRFSRSETARPAASAARTATGNSGTLTAGFAVFDFLVDVTAVSGTAPTLVVSVEESTDGTTWTAVVTGASLNSVTTQRLRGTVQRKHYRVVWTIGGTGPSFTFSVAGDVK